MALAFLFHYFMLNMFRMLIHHPQELATYLLSYFMGSIALVRCVLVLRCGLTGVVWYLDAGLNLSLHPDTTPP
jgi:hypothetical protein